MGMKFFLCVFVYEKIVQFNERILHEFVLLRDV